MKCYTISDYMTGKKFAKVNGAIVEVLDCEEAANGCVRIVAKLPGGSRAVFNSGEMDINLADEKKRRLPDWVKRGSLIRWNGCEDTDVIESVGNNNVYLHRNGRYSLSNILIDFHMCSENAQPGIDEGVKVGAMCYYTGLKCEVLDVQGYMAKVRIDYGCGIVCESSADCRELTPIPSDSHDAKVA